METAEYHDVYQNQADEYERLVAREDYEGNILPALQEICDLDGRVVVDLGTGTGRLLKLLAPHATAVFGFDGSPAMLSVAWRDMQAKEVGNWAIAAADHRQLPLGADCCDLLVSGWSLCYLALDQGPEWRDDLRVFMRRLQELIRPGGTVIIMETMGTGFRKPNPPPNLDDYFEFLSEIGLRSRWIRTDYRFGSVQEAVELTRFFFGEELAQQVARDGSPIVPECTGIWWTNDVAGLRIDG